MSPWRDLALYWVGQSTSQLGSWLLTIALPLYVEATTGSAISTGFTFVSSLVPGLVLGPVAGALVDRWNRRRTMVVVDLAQAALLTVLLEPHAHPAVWVIDLVAVGQSCLSQFYGPAGTALLPALVPEAKLAAANSALSAGSELAMLAGPALGGFLFARAGLRVSVALDLASFVVSAATIWSLRSRALRTPPSPPAPESHDSSRLLAQLVQGARVTLGNATLRALLAISLLLSVAGGLLPLLVVNFARSSLHASGTDYGLVLSAQAIGGLLGAAVAAPVIRFFVTPRLPLGGSFLAIALVVTAFGLARQWWVAALCLAVGGIPTTVSQVVSSRLLQTVPADRHRGRVASLVSTATTLGRLVGSLAAGLLAVRAGAAGGLEVVAVVFALSGLLALAAVPGQA